jgi:exodeoxyribonuclease VII large subunit
MDRLPFDPARARGPEPPPGDRPARRERRYRTLSEAEHLTVTEVAGLIKTTLETRIASPLRVIGQVSNLSAKHHWYFSLKDEAAVLSCVAWASSARRFGFTPADGDEVIATGHVSHYPAQGRTQLYVTALAPVGAGELQRRFEAMCAELRELGYFDDERKRTMPAFPRKIAVITSASGAAVQDVITTAHQRCPAVGLVVVDVRVQGDGAAEEVARAIRWVDARHEDLGVDAIVVTRGGGSLEDLWAFNERVVADATLHCTLPIAAAIGHESDTTVIELVADLRASTPTQAAMRLVPSAAELTRQVDHLADRLRLLTGQRLRHERQRVERLSDLTRVTRARIDRERARLERAAARLHALRPQAIVAHRHARLAVLADRLHRAVAARADQRGRIDGLHRRLHASLVRALGAERGRLAAMQREFDAVDPERVLQRGFTYTVRADGALLRSVAEATEGDVLRTHVPDGAVESVVSGAAEAPAKRTRRRGQRKPDGRDQMDLFRPGE